MEIIFALIPFILIGFFLIFMRFKASSTLLITYFITLLIMIFIWKMEALTIVFSSLKGFLLASEVFLIVLSILLLYNILKFTGKLDMIRDFLLSRTEDKNFQIIIIGWFMVSFFEGIAGFGTPAALTAPLLVFLGIAPITAITITLLANSVAVTFGAFGTPINIGMAEVLSSTTLFEITFLSAILSSIPALLMPLILILVYNFMEKSSDKKIRKYVLPSLLAGVFFLIPYILSAYFLGPELPSVLASIIGLALFLCYLKFLNPLSENLNRKFKRKWIFAFIPYLVLIFSLLLTRLNILGLGDLLRSLSLDISFSSQISHSFNLYNPWFLILLISILSLIFYRISYKKQVEIFSELGKNSSPIIMTLFLTLALVQLMIFSGVNNSGYLSMPQTIALSLSGLGFLYLFFAPLIAALGSFMAGSATVSNIISTPIHLTASEINSLPSSLTLALQNTGAGAGNMIALHNILAVSAIVGVRGEESRIIRFNILFALLYCFILSLTGLLIYFLFFI